jgi:hypothetical protein
MADEVIEMGAFEGGRKMASRKGGGLERQVDRAVNMLARERAGLGSRAGFGRPGFGNIRREELAGRFGHESFLGAIIPKQVKPVPVILGTVVGVGVNSAVGRLLESPAVGINANPLLARVLLAGAGVLGHIALKTDFTLGFMVGQFPGLIDAGVSAIMDMALGETSLAGAGNGLGVASQETLNELRALRRKLEGEGATGQGAVPMGLRARAAA